MFSFRKVLEKTKNNIMSGVENVLKQFVKIDDQLFEELEETLILADIGAKTSSDIIEKVKDTVKRKKISDVSEIKDCLIEEMANILNKNHTPLEIKSPTVILVIGVNGVGKTTTIAKLGNVYRQEGKKVIFAAADTFRAAAIDQLDLWAKRASIDIIKQTEGSDPGAVIFDAVSASKSRNVDILICDTAGRLHNKKNLMDELKKIYKIINQNYENANIESWLVLDATSGQNALQQAKAFKETANITGLVLTKLDGTAKGGVVIAIQNELNVPVRFVGVGESMEDIKPFDPQDFASAIFS